MRRTFREIILHLFVHFIFYASAQWKNFIEINVPEGKPAPYTVYDALPLPTGRDRYSLLYAQKGDSLDKVGLFKVSPSGVITTVQPLILRERENRISMT